MELLKMDIINKIKGRLRIIYYGLCRAMGLERTLTTSPEKIDVIIPVIRKDLETLPLCVEGLRNCVTSPISAIYIVAPRDEAIVGFCEKEGLCFVEESSVLGYTAKDINFITEDGTNRSGWIFQQLLKLSGKIGKEDYFLICDADHVLLRPHVFLAFPDMHVFYQSKEYNAPYYEAIKRLTGRYDRSPLSYVAHKMIFSKKVLSLLKKDIESRCRQPWDKAICSILDKRTASPFSEYELYGSYVKKGKKINRLWENKNLPDTSIAPYGELRTKYAGKYKAVTFPGYL